MPTKKIDKDKAIFDPARNEWVCLDEVDSGVELLDAKKVLSPEEQNKALQINLKRAGDDLRFLQDDYGEIFEKYQKAARKEQQYERLKTAYEQTKKDFEELADKSYKQQKSFDELHRKTDMIVQQAISFELDTAEFSSKINSKNIFFRQLLGYFKRGARFITESEVERIVSIIERGMSLK